MTAVCGVSHCIVIFKANVYSDTNSCEFHVKYYQLQSESVCLLVADVCWTGDIIGRPVTTEGLNSLYSLFRFTFSGTKHTASRYLLVKMDYDLCLEFIEILLINFLLCLNPVF